MPATPDNKLLQKILRDTFSSSREKNSSYSIRAYSKKLGINHSALSEIMSGRRRIGAAVAKRLTEALLLSPEITRAILVPEERPTAVASQQSFFEVEADQYRAIADWSHFGLLSLAETRSFRSDTAWIASRLGLTKSEVSQVIRRLKRLNMIEVRNEKIRVTGRSFSSPDGVANAAVRSTHHRLLSLAQESLQRDPVQSRDLTSITMAIDPAKIEEARLRIRQFRNDLCAFLESGEKKEVYSMSLQLFPLSKEV